MSESSAHVDPQHVDPSHEEVARLELDESIPPRPEEEIADALRADPANPAQQGSRGTI